MDPWCLSDTLLGVWASSGTRAMNFDRGRNSWRAVPAWRQHETSMLDCMCMVCNGCNHRSVSGPNFASYITQILFEKETVRIFTDARGCWHVSGIRPMVSVDTALVGNLASHAMSWPFALHVSCGMHRLVRHSTCSRLRRTCVAPLLVIGPG